MIVPGLDRIDGTAVNGELLNSDQLWQEHTTELMELWSKENDERTPDERVSMVEFCAPYAKGLTTTLAMRRALARKEWTIDKEAVRLQQDEEHSTRPSAAFLGNEETEKSNSGRRRRPKDATIARSGTTKPDVPVPGIVLAAGAGFVYEQSNELFRKALHRFRDILTAEGLFVTPDHACHVTIATLQKYSTQPPAEGRRLASADDCAHRLRNMKPFLDEINKGPVILTVDRVHIPDSGDTIIVLFQDKKNRIASLRNVVKAGFAKNLDDLKIPSIIHSSIARITVPPACTRAIMAQRLEGIFDNLEVTLNSVDLVLEDREPYFMLFPDGSVGHWELRENSSPTISELRGESAKPVVEEKSTPEGSFEKESAVAFSVVLFVGAMTAWWISENLIAPSV
jgi:hypothetical protein